VGRTFGEFLDLDKINFVAQTTADSARRELISGFVDIYLRLTIDAGQVVQTELIEVQPEQ
jgi:hypothetical protein